MTEQHGGNIFGYQDIIDFSANINPLGMPEKVKKALHDSIDTAEKYPDPYCTELSKKIAVYEKTNAENIICGNGADDIIFRIVHTFKPEKALICAPTFSEYRRALSEIGCEVYEHILSEDNGFAVTSSLADKLDESFDICFICSPNNPTGQLISMDVMKAIAMKCNENNIILVCDECFMGFVENSENYTLNNYMNDNCIILKAFTKLYAMPGIRLGYAVCGSPSVAEKICSCGQFWSVSSLAQAAGSAALDEIGYTEKTVDYITYERRFMLAELTDIGIKVFDSAADFLLLKSSTDLYEKMLMEGFLIRSCGNFSGLTDDFYRIAIRTHDENKKFISAVRRCMNG